MVAIPLGLGPKMGDGTRISPQASIKFSVQEREDIVGALYDGYIAAGGEGFGQRAWGLIPSPDLP